MWPGACLSARGLGFRVNVPKSGSQRIECHAGWSCRAFWSSQLQNFQKAACNLRRRCGRGGGTEMGTKKPVCEREKKMSITALGHWVGRSRTLGQYATPFLFPSDFSPSTAAFSQRLSDPCRPALGKYSPCLPPPDSLCIPLIRPISRLPAGRDSADSKPQLVPECLHGEAWQTACPQAAQLEEKVEGRPGAEARFVCRLSLPRHLPGLFCP